MLQRIPANTKELILLTFWLAGLVTSFCSQVRYTKNRIYCPEFRSNLLLHAMCIGKALVIVFHLVEIHAQMRSSMLEVMGHLGPNVIFSRIQVVEICHYTMQISL